MYLATRRDVDAILTGIAFILVGVTAAVIAAGDLLDTINSQIVAITAIAASLTVLWKTTVLPMYRAVRNFVDTVEAIAELPNHVAQIHREVGELKEWKRDQAEMARLAQAAELARRQAGS